jgi:hypothetical protein
MQRVIACLKDDYALRAMRDSQVRSRVIECRDDFNCKAHLAAYTLKAAHDAVFSRHILPKFMCFVAGIDRHEVGNSEYSRGGVERRFQNVRVLQIPPAGELQPVGADRAIAAAPVIEQVQEHCRAIKVWEAGPVN